MPLRCSSPLPVESDRAVRSLLLHNLLVIGKCKNALNVLTRLRHVFQVEQRFMSPLPVFVKGCLFKLSGGKCVIDAIIGDDLRLSVDRMYFIMVLEDRGVILEHVLSIVHHLHWALLLLNLHRSLQDQLLCLRES